MAVTRKEPAELGQEMKILLNRPDEDDLFLWPEEYFMALSKAHRRIYKKIAAHAAHLLLTETTVTTSDAGLTYDLGDYHLGQIEVWAPPGPPTGERIKVARPDSSYFGFWIDGTVLRFTSQKEYSSGLYIRWVPETVADLAEDSTHSLPAYCEDMMVYEACYIMAQKSGFAGNPESFRALSTREWAGDPADPSDMGILGIIKRDAFGRGFETHAGMVGQPWHRNIG